MEFGPDTSAGAEYQQAHRFATKAQRQHKQPRTPILLALWLSGAYLNQGRGFTAETEHAARARASEAGPYSGAINRRRLPD